MKLRFNQIFLAASIISLLITILWLAYPGQNRRYHLVLTGMGRGRIHPFKAKFKPYQGKKMGGAAGVASVIKETVASFSGDPFNVFSIGTEISGTADSYFSRGASVIQTMNAVGVEAMLPGNIEFSYGRKRLAELSKEAEFGFVSSNIVEKESGRTPSWLSSELFFNPGLGLKIGLLGITPPETPNLTARSNIEGLEFLQPGDVLKSRVDALKRAGADIVVLLTLFSRDRISLQEWRLIASASPDICVMLDYEIEPPPSLKKDGVIIQTVSGYNQSKEVDILDLELTPPPTQIVRFSSRRLAVNHAEITPDPQVAAVAEKVTRQSRELKDVFVGSFAEDYARSYASECPIGNMIADAMLAESGADIAIQNSGGVHGNIQAGDFTLGDLFSIMPFDNQIVQMTLSGRDLLDIFSVSASLKRGVLQVANASYTFIYRNDGDFVLKSLLVAGEPVVAEKDYAVCTNNFLAEGGDNFISFRKGRNVQFGRQQRDVIREYIVNKAQNGPVTLKTEGRIVRE